MILEIILIILSFVLAVIGFLGVVFPILPFPPGIFISWLGILIFGIATNFIFISWKIILIFLFFTTLACILDFLMPLLGAGNYKASKEGMIGFVLGSFIGLIIGGPIGMIIGPFLGLVFGEIYKGRESKEISYVLRGAFLGFVVNGALKIVLSLTMIVYLIVAVFKI